MQAICHLPVDEPFRLLRRYRCLPELAESISRPTRHRIVHLNDPYACQPSMMPMSNTDMWRPAAG